jgi:hypothetical protein
MRRAPARRRRGPLAAAGVAAALLVATACEGALPSACPGDRVATLRFQGTAEPLDGGCAFAPDGGVPVSFTATLAYAADDAALLCVERAEAAPLRGTRRGDEVAVAAPPQPGTVPACACALQVTERVAGALTRLPDGAADRFDGVLENAVEPAGGSAAGCEPDGGPADAGPRCGAPCTLRWRLVGAR